jgi:SAM-dependent methyltransferase
MSENHPEEILDATCGGRSIWLPGSKHHENTLYIDKREREPGFTGQEGRTFSVEPDEVEDFRDLPYADESFNLVVFDPPHLVREDGQENLTGYITKSYGALHAETWQSDLEAGFNELFRVLSPGGTLVFKFADNNVDFNEVLELAPRDPLFGTTTKKNSKVENRWFVFHKPENKS